MPGFDDGTVDVGELMRATVGPPVNEVADARAREACAGCSYSFVNWFPVVGGPRRAMLAPGPRRCPRRQRPRPFPGQGHTAVRGCPAGAPSGRRNRSPSGRAVALAGGYLHI